MTGAGGRAGPNSGAVSGRSPTVVKRTVGAVSRRSTGTPRRRYAAPERGVPVGRGAAAQPEGYAPIDEVGVITYA